MRIDLKAILQRTVSNLYGDLVTRPTGEAVRGGVEQVLEALDGEQIAVIDFGTVGCLDISCADEVVGKLLLQHGQARYFFLHGVTSSHCEAIEQVLERHRLAVVARDREGRVRVLGPMDETARLAFTLLSDGGPADAEELASRLSLPPEAVRQALEVLRGQRLVQRSSDGYMALSA